MRNLMGPVPSALLLLRLAVRTEGVLLTERLDATVPADTGVA
jgi:hypothetical protein